MMRPPPIGLMSYTLLSSDGVVRPAILQLLRVVAALHRAVRAAEAELAAEVVAAVARDDVEDDAGRLRFAEAAGGAEHHFLRARHVRRIAAARAAAGPPGVVAVATRSANRCRGRRGSLRRRRRCRR